RLPYDRHNTSMAAFPLCEDCRKDYGDVNNLRRFHGQGISCPKCGPKTRVYTSRGVELGVKDPVAFVAEKIVEGAIVAIKGVGGYHIACLASDGGVLKELRQRKNRPTQPFAVMARDFDTVLEIAYPPPGARELLESPQRPIVVMPKRGGRLSELVSPGLSTVGVMLPYTAFQALLLQKIPDGFLVMTSGNIHGRPMCTTLGCVLSELSHVVDYVVEHEREIVHRVDDSVVRMTDGQPVFLRRARGYAPEWIEVGVELGEAVAVGAELQAAGAVSFEDKIVPTQYIGDLDEWANLQDLERELFWLVETYGLRPEVVALDMHPLYHNRKLARELGERFGAEVVEVQHHHAHVASVLAELRAPPDVEVVGIAIDGTGYGDDGGIWGGEVLLATSKSYRRVGSLKPYVLPGGDATVKYPTRSLIAMLASFGFEEEEVLKLVDPLALPYGEKEARLIYTLARAGRGPVSTSLGRALDGFSALLGACVLRTYEGEPAMRLESLADRGGEVLDYGPKLAQEGGRLVVDVADMLMWVVEMLERGAKPEDLAATVLYSLGRGLGLIAAAVGRSVSKVAVSGGAAVNTYIVRGIKDAVRPELEVVLPKKIPPGDGGIAVGQIVAAV
ncbi:MAG: carbamoyltransferase HypF, partial [Pyrobaculum sp.]